MLAETPDKGKRTRTAATHIFVFTSTFRQPACRNSCSIRVQDRVSARVLLLVWQAGRQAGLSSGEMIYYDWINNQLEPGQNCHYTQNEFPTSDSSRSRSRERGPGRQSGHVYSPACSSSRLRHESRRGDNKCFAKIVRPRFVSGA